MKAERVTSETISFARRLRATGAGLTALALAACAHSPVAGRGHAAGGAAEAAGNPSISASATPSSSRALLRLADRLLADNAPAAALALYREAWAAGGKEEKALSGIGRAQLALGRPELAIDTLSRAVDKPGASGRTWRAYGESLLGMGRFEQAAAAFDEALARGADPAALSAKAVALDALARHAEALELFQQARTMAPGDANLASNYALSLALHGETGEALEIFRRIARQGLAGLAHRHNLALTLTLGGELEQARRLLRVDLDSDEASSTLEYYLEIAALPAKDRVAAIVAASRPVSRAPSDVAVPVLADDEKGRKAAARLMTPPAPPPPPAPEPVELPPLLDPTGWSVQIAAYRTSAQLIRGQHYYWRKFAEVLKGQAPRRSEVDYGSRKRKPRGFFYRLNVGELRGRDEAYDLCRRLKAAGAPCWVRPPEPSEGRLPDGTTETSAAPTTGRSDGGS